MSCDFFDYDNDRSFATWGYASYAQYLSSMRYTEYDTDEDVEYKRINSKYYKEITKLIASMDDVLTLIQTGDVKDSQLK